MRSFPILIASVLLSLLGICAPQGPPAKEPPAPVPATPIPARAAPSDYQGKTQVGKFTIAADFTSHSVPTSMGPLTTEDFVVVEVAVFGPPDAKLKLSADDFSLRINGAKKPLPITHFEMVFRSLKDPEYIPPEPPPEKGSKTGINAGGKGGGAGGDGPPAPAKIPVPVMRAMAQRVQKSALPEGDRALPQAGLIFFGYRPKTKSIQSLELLYEGPAGKATLVLQ